MAHEPGSLRVGVVSYFAPPDAAVASHRVMRLTRVLAAVGHEVHWVTVDEGRLWERDDTLAALTPKHVVRHRLGGPTLWSLGTSRTLLEKVRRTIAYELGRRLPIPDPHYEWVRRLCRRLPQLARQHRFDAVVVTCGPHGQLLALPDLRRAVPGIRVFVDYRDLLSGNSWTGSDDDRVRARVLRHERAILAQADALFVNSEEALRTFLATIGEAPCPVEVMRNAADFGLADEIAARWPAVPVGDGVHLGFFGTIFPRRRMLPVLRALEAMPPAARDRTTLHVFSGAADSRRMLEEDLVQVGSAVRPRVVVHDYEPFAQALRTMMAMTALVLLNGAEPADNIFVPGKLYDYLMARWPVLFLGDHGDAWRIVAQTSGPGRCFRHDETAAVAQAIGQLSSRPRDLAPAAEHAAERAFAPLLARLAAVAAARTR